MKYDKKSFEIEKSECDEIFFKTSFDFVKTIFFF